MVAHRQLINPKLKCIISGLLLVDVKKRGGSLVLHSGASIFYRLSSVTSNSMSEAESKPTAAQIIEILQRESTTTVSNASAQLHREFPLYSRGEWAKWIQNEKDNHNNADVDDLHSDIEVLILSETDFVARFLKRFRVSRVNWIVAIFSFALSSVSAMCISSQWFKLTERGAFILAVSSLNILLRCVQYRFLGVIHCIFFIELFVQKTFYRNAGSRGRPAD